MSRKERRRRRNERFNDTLWKHYFFLGPSKPNIRQPILQVVLTQPVRSPHTTSIPSESVENAQI